VNYANVLLQKFSLNEPTYNSMSGVILLQRERLNAKAPDKKGSFMTSAAGKDKEFFS